MKNIHIFLIISTITLQACTNKQKSLEQSIKNIEQSDSATADNGIEALNKLYFEYASSFPEAPQSAGYLHRVAMHAFLKREFKLSRDLSLQYEKQYPKGIDLAPTLLNLARVYLYGIEMPDSAVYYFKKAGNIRALTTIDLNELGTAMEKVADKNPASESADMYFQAANHYQKSGASANAIRCLSKGVQLAPQHPKSPGSLQTIAFIYENELVQKDSALAYYQRLVKEYPSSEAATQASYLIKNNLVGKSAEEVLEFGIRNQSKQNLQ